MSRVDARTAQAANPSDAATIKDAIISGVGFERTNQIVTAGIFQVG
jgi:hypothetical protein